MGLRPELYETSEAQVNARTPQSPEIAGHPNQVRLIFGQVFVTQSSRMLFLKEAYAGA